MVWARGHLLFVTLISLGVSVPLWRLEHDLRLRRDFELQQLRSQAAAEIANLRARAAAALDDADSSAQRVRDLETQRLQLERVEANLKSAISNLKDKERTRLQVVAALPFPALAEELRRELGPESFDTRDAGLATRELPAASSQLPEQATDGTRSTGDSTFQIQDSRSPKPEAQTTGPGLYLTEPGARAVAAALVEREACREQSQMKDNLLANCAEQTTASRAVIDEMQRSVLSLKEAVRLKDEIQSRSEAVHRAELKAARGSRVRRFGRALQYVGAGVVVGVVISR